MEGLLFFFVPLVALIACGVATQASDERRPWLAIASLVAVSTSVWFVYVGLYQHETPCSGRYTGCPTVYGYDAPLHDEHPLGAMLMLAGFAVPAAWAGWRRLARPLAVGAALAVGPTVLAWWTAPRGDNDGLWVLIFVVIPVGGSMAAAVAAIAERVGSAHREKRKVPEGTEVTQSAARTADRLAALGIDVAILSAILVVPLTALSKAKLEPLAVVIGLAVATAWLALPMALRGHTLGQALVGLSVVDIESRLPISLRRASLRSLVIVLEVTGIPTFIFAAPAVAELVALSTNGVTLTDRVLRTTVVSTRTQ